MAKKHGSTGRCYAFYESYSRELPGKDFVVEYETSSDFPFCNVFGTFQECRGCQDYDFERAESKRKNKNMGGFKMQIKLIKPLFVNGMYNRSGKRVRAKHIKTVGKYPLWIRDGRPNKNYTKEENNKYYIYIQVGEYIFTSGDTEFDIIQKAGYEELNKKWYKNKRDEYFNEKFYKNKTYGEYLFLIKEQLDKEKEFIERHGQKDDLQEKYIEEIINKHVANYVKTRDEGGDFADFIGALCLNELDICDLIAENLTIKREEQEKIKRKEIAELKIQKEKERKKTIEKMENTFINGGIIKNNDIIIELADKYNINIPVRTKGWILNNLIEVAISNDGSFSCKYWKSKNSKGSQTIYEILYNIKDAIVLK